jgi:hypothetical protein
MISDRHTFGELLLEVMCDQRGRGEHDRSQESLLGG